MQMFPDQKTFWEVYLQHLEATLPEWTFALKVEEESETAVSENHEAYYILAKSPRFTYDLLVRCDFYHTPKTSTESLMNMLVLPIGQGGWPLTKWFAPPDDPVLGADIQEDVRELNAAMSSWKAAYQESDGSVTRYVGWALEFDLDRIHQMCETFDGRVISDTPASRTVRCQFEHFSLEVWPDNTFLPEFVFCDLRPCMGTDAARASIQLHRKAVDLYELILRTYWPASSSLEDPS